MIDWVGLGVAALWVVGSALVLVALGWASWQGRLCGRRLRAVWNPRHGLMLDAGLLGVALAILLKACGWWEIALAGVCTLAFAAQVGMDVRGARKEEDNCGDRLPGEAMAPPRKGVRHIARALQQAELPVALMLTVPMILLLQYAPYALGVAVLLWIVRWVALGHPTRPTPVDGAILILLFQAGVSLWVTAAFDLTWIALNQLLAGILVFYAVVNWVGRAGRLSAIVLLLLLLGAALTLVPLVAQMSWSDEKIFRLPDRLLSFKPVLPEDVNANVLGGNLVPILPLALAGMSSSVWRGLRKVGRVLARALAGLVSVLMLVTLVLTQSRGAAVALAVGLVGFAGLRYRWCRYALPVLLVLACVGLILVEPSQVTGRILNPYADVAERRLELWSRAIYAAQDFAFSGIGLGTFVKVIPLFYPYFPHDPDAQVGHAHNLFLQVAADLGLPGLIAYVAFLFAGVAAAWQLGRVRTDPGCRTLGAAFLAAYVILIVHGLVDAVTWGTKPAVVQWMIAGLVFATANNAARSPRVGGAADAGA